MGSKVFRKAIEPYITEERQTCSYCDIIDSLVLYRGTHFYVTAAIGSYMPGYVQLCSYQHRTSATGIRLNEYTEFMHLSQVIRRCFSKTYGNSGICFEHGQAGTCLWTENNASSLCHHMHIHFVPARMDIHKKIADSFPTYFTVSDIAEMVKIRTEVLQGGPYLYFSNNQEFGYMYDVSGREVPRQFLRRCVSEELEITHRADWKQYPGVEFFAQTISDLSQMISIEATR